MSEAYTPAPAEMQEATPIQPVDEMARIEGASKRVLGGIVTESYDIFQQRTEATFSSYLKEKAGSTIDRLRNDIPEIVGMTVFGSAARGEAVHQKENGLSSDIDGTILIDVDKNPSLAEKVIRNDSLLGAPVNQFDSLRMDMDYTMALTSGIEPALREVTGRDSLGTEVTKTGEQVSEKDDIEIRPISDRIIVEQIEAMCETAKTRKELREQGVTDQNKLPFFASRNIRALFQPAISGDLNAYSGKALEAFKAMEQVYGKDIRDTAWAMHAHGVNQFHNGRNPNAAPLLEENFDKYVSELPVVEAEQKATTSNGHEIEHPREKMGAIEFKSMVAEYGIEGKNPKERAESLKKLPAEQVALFLADLNRRVQGSEETLVNEKIMKIGDKQTIQPEHRYDLFVDLMNQIKDSGDINPERVGDTLALGTVLLHPFADGNGRTARTLGMILRSDFDDVDFNETFDQLAEPRDVARMRGGYMINGYTPFMGEGANQSDPQVVSAYFNKLLTTDESLYTSPYGQAALKAAQ